LIGFDGHAAAVSAAAALANPRSAAIVASIRHVIITLSSSDR
jgi:hypothetical protein